MELANAKDIKRIWQVACDILSGQFESPYVKRKLNVEIEFEISKTFDSNEEYPILGIDEMRANVDELMYQYMEKFLAERKELNKK